MRTKRKTICEVLFSTIIVATMTVAFFWLWSIIINWNSQNGWGSLVIGFLYGVFLGLITMGVYIVPSALFVSILMVNFNRWSVRGVASIFCAVVICSSVSS